MKDITLKPRATATEADPYPESGEVKAPASTATISHQIAWYSDTLVGSPLSGDSHHYILEGDTTATAFAKLDKQVNVVTQTVSSGVVASVTAGNSGITIGGTGTAPTVGVKVSSGEGNQISISGDGLYVPTPPAQTDYTISVTSNAGTSETSYATQYTISQPGASGSTKSWTIDIPKDMVVSSGQVVDKDSSGAWGDPGKYVELTLANAASDKIYIAVQDLVDVYTAEDNAAQVQLTISGDNEISASIVAGSIGTTELASGAVTEAKIANNAVTSSRIASGAVDATKLAVVASGSQETVNNGTAIATADYVTEVVGAVEDAVATLGSAKMDKVDGGTEKHIVVLDATGNAAEFGIDIRDVVTSVSNDNGDATVILSTAPWSGDDGCNMLSASLNEAYVSGGVVSGQAQELSTTNQLMTYVAVSGIADGKMDKTGISDGIVLMANNSGVDSTGFFAADVVVDIQNSHTVGNDDVENTVSLSVSGGSNGNAGAAISAEINNNYVSGTVGTSNKLMTYSAVSGLIQGAASHTHGNITYEGTLQTNDVSIASGDKLVITDASDSNKIARASAEFDGSTTTTALTPAGTFASFLQGTSGAGLVLSGSNHVALDTGVISGTLAANNPLMTWTAVSGIASGLQSGLNTKADKVTSATANNIATLDASGNLQDGGFNSGNVLLGVTDTDTFNVSNTYTNIITSGSVTVSGDVTAHTVSADMVSGGLVKAGSIKNPADDEGSITVPQTNNGAIETMATREWVNSNALVGTSGTAVTTSGQYVYVPANGITTTEISGASVTTAKLADLTSITLIDESTVAPYSGQKYKLSVSSGRLIVSGYTA